MTTLSFSAVGRTRMQSGVAFATYHLIAIVLLSQNAQRRLDDATAKSEHQVQGRLLLYVVIGQSATILQLFTCKDETLLVGRNALLVLNLGLHIFDRVGGLDL